MRAAVARNSPAGSSPRRWSDGSPSNCSPLAPAANARAHPRMWSTSVPASYSGQGVARSHWSSPTPSIRSPVPARMPRSSSISSIPSVSPVSEGPGNGPGRQSPEMGSMPRTGGGTVALGSSGTAWNGGVARGGAVVVGSRGRDRRARRGHDGRLRRGRRRLPRGDDRRRGERPRAGVLRGLESGRDQPCGEDDGDAGGGPPAGDRRPLQGRARVLMPAGVGRSAGPRSRRRPPCRRPRPRSMWPRGCG